MHTPRTRTDSLYFDYPLFPFRRPPEMEAARAAAAGRPVDDASLPVHPVAIVGGGPSGLVLALELARFGVRSVVLEADETVAEGSRAACVSRRSMEIFRGVGADSAFLREALPWTHGTSYWRDQPVFRLQMPHSPDERFHPMANLQQNMIEEVLVERIERCPLIELRWQSRVVGLEQRGSPRADGEGMAVLTVDTPEGEYALHARWVVAADGARSGVRQLLNLRLAGESFEGRYLIADFRMASPHPTERRAWFDPPTNPGHTVLMHKLARDMWRIDYQLADEADEAVELSEPRVRERISRHLAWIGEDTPWTLDWIRLYKAHCLCLDDYRHGRVFFIGDAAHLVPIFGVRGMNSSLADANNLGWKLAAVLQGTAGDALLDSYTPERRAATFDVFTNARRSTLFMTPPTRGWRLVRDAALQLSMSHDWARDFVNPRQSAPYDYVESPLTTPDDPQDDWRCGPRAGAPLASVQLSPGRYLTDCLDHVAGFTLIVFGPSGTRAGRRAWQPLAEDGIALRFVERVSHGASDDAPETVADPQGCAQAAHDARDGDCVLVRPDGHVCARLRAAPMDRQLQRVRAARRRALAAVALQAQGAAECR